MVELSDIEMKEVEPATPASSVPVAKDEKKDADTLTLDGSFYFTEGIMLKLRFRFQRYQRTSSYNRKSGQC